ncbi:MAG: heme exporter protein CcmD [Methylococcales bacterium]|nr:heme exporter protein CcmD [Methylococcales bacterium]
MTFNSFAEFLAMGGYAFYVWGSYGLTLIVLLANIIIPVWQRKQLLRSLALKQQRSES